MNICLPATEFFTKPNKHQSLHMYVSYVPLNQARFCLLLLLTFISYLSVYLCPPHVEHKRTMRIVTYMRIMKSSFVVFVSFVFLLLLLFLFSWVFFSLHLFFLLFFLLKKTSIKGRRCGDRNWMNNFIVSICKEETELDLWQIGIDQLCPSRD